jgi:hypothetical protein
MSGFPQRALLQQKGAENAHLVHMSSLQVYMHFLSVQIYTANECLSLPAELIWKTIAMQCETLHTIPSESKITHTVPKPLLHINRHLQRALLAS